MGGDCAAADDNPMKLMSIAMKPLCAPPFPLDYIEEMPALMLSLIHICQFLTNQRSFGGAGYGTRTRRLLLGKQSLYRMS